MARGGRVCILIQMDIGSLNITEWRICFRAAGSIKFKSPPNINIQIQCGYGNYW